MPGVSIIVVDGSGNGVGNMLKQSASEENVEGLNTKADSERWLPGAKGCIEQPEIRFIAIWMDHRDRGLHVLAVAGRIDVAGAAGKHDAVEIFSGLSGAGRNERDLHRNSAGGNHRLGIFHRKIVRTLCLVKTAGQ